MRTFKVKVNGSFVTTIKAFTVDEIMELVEEFYGRTVNVEVTLS